MMEGCNSGLQTNNTLMNSHFPGSTQCTFNSQPTSHEQVEAVSETTDKIVNDKGLKDLTFLDPNRVKEAFNDCLFVCLFVCVGPRSHKLIL